MKNSLLEFLNNFIALPLATKISLVVIGIVIIDIFSAFRYYYLERGYLTAINLVEEKRLDYLRKTVISGYKILADEKNILTSINKVRNLEKKLNKDPMNFSQYKTEYKKNIKDVLKRGYF
jgi:hypothetical protein